MTSIKPAGEVSTLPTWTNRLVLRAYSIADPRADGLLDSLGRAMDEAAPDLLPEVMDYRDPPRQAVTTMQELLGALVATLPVGGAVDLYGERHHGIAGSYSLDLVTHAATDVPSTTPRSESRLRKNSHSQLSFGWAAAPFRGNADLLGTVNRLFDAICETFHAFYGCVELGAIDEQRWKTLGVQTYEESKIPDVVWLNYFGPAMVERWGGAERLLSLGVTARVNAHGGVAIQATDDPFYLRDVSAIDDYGFKQPFYETIGADAFSVAGYSTRSDRSDLVPTPEQQYRWAPQVVQREDFGA